MPVGPLNLFGLGGIHRAQNDREDLARDIFSRDLSFTPARPRSVFTIEDLRDHVGGNFGDFVLLVIERIVRGAVTAMVGVVALAMIAFARDFTTPLAAASLIAVVVAFVGKHRNLIADSNRDLRDFFDIGNLADRFDEA